MGDAAQRKLRQDPAERAAAAALTKEQAEIRERRAKAQLEYERVTEFQTFSKDFNTALDALMRDELASPAQRVLAYIKRYSWGEYSLWAIGADGHPLYQKHCGERLGLKKRVISKAVAYLQERGYLVKQPKLLYPVIAPQLTAPDPQTKKSKAYATFLDNWKVANAGDFQRWEDARAVDKHFKKVVHAEFRRDQKSQTRPINGSASLYRSAGEGPKNPQRAVISPFEADNLRHHKAPAQDPVEEETGITAPQAEELVHSQIATMQQANPNTPFSKPAIDRNNPGDVGLVKRILHELGPLKNGRFDEQHVIGYLIHISAQFKGFTLGGARKAPRDPSSPTGPKSLGLLVTWAQDYVRIAGRGGAA